MNLKYRFRNIDTNCANFAHGRLPSMWLRFYPTTLWHFDAAEWAPSTASFADKPSQAKIDVYPLLSNRVLNGASRRTTLCANSGLVRGPSPSKLWALDSAHIDATHMPMEEPSTA